MRTTKYFGGNNLLHLCNENKLADMKDKLFWKHFSSNNLKEYETLLMSVLKVRDLIF